jgi:iron complex outermembrane receptor protein
MSPHHTTLVRSLALATALAASGLAANAQERSTILPETYVTASRIDIGLPGTSTTVIDGEEIRRAPSRSLPELLGLEAGVQNRDLFGNTAGARAAVDLRGFGASSSQNTLFLVNGRRLNAIDNSAIDFANIPLDSLERIEIVRGNAGGVLYGDGAVGGVVNFVTKAGAPRPLGGSADAGLGSDRYRDANLAAFAAGGPWSLNAYGAFIDSDGFRENNKLVQRNLVSELRRQFGKGDAFVNLQLDDQTLQLPGVRRVTLATSQLATDPEGASTPFDQAWQNGLAATIGGTHQLTGDIELIVDGGVRRKDQEGIFISAFGAAFDNYVDTDLTTWSVTPRARIVYDLLGLSSKSTVGIDYYYSDYNSDRKNNPSATPVHRYDANQSSAAVYAQNTVALTGATDVGFGLRLQNTRVEAGDSFDPTAPGAFGAADQPLDDSDTEWAANLGLEHRFTSQLAAFGRVARSIRVPTIDERIGATGTSLALRTQTSRDAEVGTRIGLGRARLQASAYVMELKDEIHFDPNVNFGTNINLDPTRRYGAEVAASAPIADDLSGKAAVTYTRAKFTEGQFDGNDVPLVAPYTASGSLSWNAPKQLYVTGTIKYVSDKRLDNDQANFQPKIPDYTVVDLKVGGALGPFTWSAQVANLFDVDYFNYGVASATTFGTYNAYPLPGRTFLVRFGGRL